MFYVGVLVDDRPLSEREKALQRQAEQALQVRDDLLTIIAHELKTPLTSVIGYTQLLQSRSGTFVTPEDMQILDLILAQAERLNDMLNTLLDSSRVQQGAFVLHKSYGDIMQTIRRVVAEVQIGTKKHIISLSHDPQNHSIMLTYDPQRIEQAVRNLLTNAIQYTPDGGVISVLVDRITDSQQDQLVLTVADQGIGVPEEAIPLLFNLYFRAKNVGKSVNTQISGLGVGLFVTKEIVNRHGGEITVHSDGKFRGTTFIVRIPL